MRAANHSGLRRGVEARLLSEGFPCQCVQGWLTKRFLRHSEVKEAAKVKLNGFMRDNSSRKAIQNRSSGTCLLCEAACSLGTAKHPWHSLAQHRKDTETM